MKILVAAKRVLDEEIPVQLKEDASGVDLSIQRTIINPFDAVALEEAIQLKEKGIASEVIVVSCGPDDCKRILRSALAFGADKAILIETSEDLQSLATSKLLAAVARKENVDLILCGKQATDTDSGETPPMLAGLLGFGQALVASTLHIEKSIAYATCEILDGHDRVAVKLPAVISVTDTLNTPRHLSLKAAMQANKKTIETITPEDLKVDASPRLKLVKLETPTPRKPPVRVKSVDELLTHLRDEAGVL